MSKNKAVYQFLRKEKKNKNQKLKRITKKINDLVIEERKLKKKIAKIVKEMSDLKKKMKDDESSSSSSENEPEEEMERGNGPERMEGMQSQSSV